MLFREVAFSLKKKKLSGRKLSLRTVQAEHAHRKRTESINFKGEGVRGGRHSPRRSFVACRFIVYEQFRRTTTRERCIMQTLPRDIPLFFEGGGRRERTLFFVEIEAAMARELALSCENLSSMTRVTRAKSKKNISR